MLALTSFLSFTFGEFQMTTKVVYNACYGGFSLSDKAVTRLKELGSTIDSTYLPWQFPRHDPLLVQVVEELKAEANTWASKLCIKEVSGPYRIDEYDGIETVYEPDDYAWVTP